MRWQYWALIVLVTCLGVLAVDLGRWWPIVLAAGSTWLVWITQHQRDRFQEQTRGKS